MAWICPSVKWDFLSAPPYVCLWQALKLLCAHVCSIFGTVVTNVNRFVWNSVYFNYVTRDTHWQWLVMKDGYEQRQCVVWYLFIQVVSSTPYPRDPHKLDIKKWFLIVKFLKNFYGRSRVQNCILVRRWYHLSASSVYQVYSVLEMVAPRSVMRGLSQARITKPHSVMQLLASLLMFFYDIYHGLSLS